MQALQQLALFCHFHSMSKRLDRPKLSGNYKLKCVSFQMDKWFFGFVSTCFNGCLLVVQHKHLRHHVDDTNRNSWVHVHTELYRNILWTNELFIWNYYSSRMTHMMRWYFLYWFIKCVGLFHWCIFPVNCVKEWAMLSAKSAISLNSLNGIRSHLKCKNDYQ